MLLPDPCFIATIRRASGSKRALVHVGNATGQAVELTVAEVSKPEWLDLEGLMIGDTLTIKKGGKAPITLNLNTDHRFFPTDRSAQESALITFTSGLSVTILVYLQEIIATVESFRGTFAMDFGTTNTCYAWKSRVGDRLQMSDALKPPEASREVPTLVQFKDISNREQPQVAIGNHAREFIARNAGKTFQYSISIKRLLGLERELTILDERSGLDPGRFQRYRPEEVASFYIRETLKDAEAHIGQRIETVVATFPILFSRRQQNALRSAFRKAFEGLGREWRDDRLVLRLDETNAAAFTYIYGQLLDEFRRFTVDKRGHRLLSYDFGGGTIDVSLVDVDLARDPSGRLTVQTNMLGITGDRHLGGDLVTLAVHRLLKSKLALAIARQRVAVRDAARQAAANSAKSSTEAANPWSFAAPAAMAATTANDPWASLVGSNEAAPAAAAPVEDDAEDPVTADITCMVVPEQLEAAWDTLVRQAEVIDAAARWGLTPAGALERLIANGVLQLSPLARNETAKAISEAIDTVLPTAWHRLEESGDLIVAETARKLFYELWLPAEVVKIRAVSTSERLATLTEPLPRIAKYAGVPVESLQGITISEDEINAAVEPQLRASIGKAAYLLRSAGGAGAAAGGGLDFGGLAAAGQTRPVTVLLAGNGARLPLVRRLMIELCQVDEANVVMDPNGLKATVAQGACEEHILRRDFGGDGGLIQYKAQDFTNRLPYSIGLFHRELGLIGFPGGFATVMPRGTAVDSQVVLTEALQVVHRKATELTCFAWFHDHELGAGGSIEPTNLGWFDLTSPEEKSWSGLFTPEVKATLEQMSGQFILVMAVDADRNLTLVDPVNYRWWKLKSSAEDHDARSQPFSGVH